MMATEADNIHKLAPSWNARQVVTFNGQHDTRISTGKPYSTRSLASLFALEPGNAAKLDGLAFIPSSYSADDARSHATQRADGSFVALCGDVDHGDHPLHRIESMVRGFAGDAAWLIFSTAHARADDKRWRIVIPLAQPMAFENWHDAQHAFFNFMEYGGVEMDRALDRAGQPVYLPNVPDHHAKTGELLRDDDGAPQFYKRATTGTQCAGPGSTSLSHSAADQRGDRHRLQRGQPGQHLGVVCRYLHCLNLHYRPPIRARARERLTLLVGRIASELSPFSADKGLDCWRIRMMPAATIRPNSESRESTDMMSGLTPFSLLMRPTPTLVPGNAGHSAPRMAGVI